MELNGLEFVQFLLFECRLLFPVVANPVVLLLIMYWFPYSFISPIHLPGTKRTLYTNV